MLCLLIFLFMVESCEPIRCIRIGVSEIFLGRGWLRVGRHFEIIFGSGMTERVWLTGLFGGYGVLR